MGVVGGGPARLEDEEVEAGVRAIVRCMQDAEGDSVAVGKQQAMVCARRLAKDHKPPTWLACGPHSYLRK